LEGVDGDVRSRPPLSCVAHGGRTSPATDDLGSRPARLILDCGYGAEIIPPEHGVPGPKHGTFAQLEKSGRWNRLLLIHEGYAKLSLKKYKPIAALNEDANVFRGLL
jgi:hypothetical protein